MNLFSKIFSVFKSTPKLNKKQMDELIAESISKNESLIERIGDDMEYNDMEYNDMDYDGMGNYGRFPPIIGDDHPTYEQFIKEYESQNPKKSARRN